MHVHRFMTLQTSSFKLLSGQAPYTLTVTPSVPVSAEQCRTLQPLKLLYCTGPSQFLLAAFPYNCPPNTINPCRLLAPTAHHNVTQIRPTICNHHKAVLAHIRSALRNVGPRRTKVTWVRAELGKRVLRLRLGGWNIRKFCVLPTQCFVWI